ncbi:acyl-CoA dehydrogenase family protein [Actinomadura chibensis]|uniref:Pilus assembly protein CpaD n=1 Tax=Actinomadura chibensis TaxID=392828 RepID=A0A5D0NDF3_9ACTN|nr:acyl-CoA dehydrogenase family protein [Actinomadura chibensis]TYB42427.1 pilus assembly protein CpaD [Actinomadura chibensis]
MTAEPGDVEAFRAEVRALLDGMGDALDPRQFFHGRGGATRDLYRELGRRGWLSLGWPGEDGAVPATLAHEFALWDELAHARAARPDLAAGIVAKTLVVHGTEYQKARFLPGIALGDVSFALGYSEPEAGSDLRAVRTRAVRDGDVYRVTGEKRWTSDAHHSDYLWLLCRAEGVAGGDPHTLLILDLRAPGVDIRPIETIDGHRLNEVFLDGVVVPVTDRVGAEGQAWSLIREALAVERHLMVLPGRVRRDLESLLGWAREHGFLGDPLLLDRVEQLTVDVQAVEVLAAEALARALDGADCTAEAARVKLVGSRATQEIARAALELGYLEATRRDDDLAFLWRESMMETLAGGSSEIMRGVLARAEFGLGGR